MMNIKVLRTQHHHFKISNIFITMRQDKLWEQRNSCNSKLILSCIKLLFNRYVIRLLHSWQHVTACICTPLLVSVGRVAVDQYFLLPGPQQQTCSSGFAAMGTCWDRWTDIIPLHRPCSTYHAASANTSTGKSLWQVGYHCSMYLSVHARFRVHTIQTKWHCSFFTFSSQSSMASCDTSRQSYCTENSHWNSVTSVC